MEPVNMLMIGCGMMGARHVRGLGELERAAPGSVRLLAVCDVDQEAAEKVAVEAEELLSGKPEVFTSVEQALAGEPALQAVDVVTDPRSHDELVIGLMESGLDVICEKPLSVTVARGRRMVEAAERAGRVLAVAENNRRDPMNRFAKACIDGGVIGDVNFALQLSIGVGSTIIATAWRHRLAMGGVLLDVSVHLGYILEYLLGPIDSICASAQLVQPYREGTEFDGKEVEVAVDAEDAFTALLGFENGVQGHWTSHFASAGEAAFKRLVLGSEGTLNAPSDRSGNPVQVQRGGETLVGEALLAALPDFRLNEIETRLFGERPAEYSLEGPVTDRKLIAAEIHDFVEAIGSGRAPEVDGAGGLRSIAIIYAVLESAVSAGPVRMADVLSGKVREYQDRVEAAEVE